MAQYTVTIRDLVANGFDLGLQDYPIYEEAYRETLNNKIINHYMMSEIGQETPGLFKLYLNNKMNEIMPKYNIMYQALAEYIESENLLGNINIKETKVETQNKDIQNSGADTNSSSGTTNQDNKKLYQDTPQGNLGTLDFENQQWATNLTLEKANNNYSSVDTITKGTKVDDDTTINSTITTIGANGKKYSVEVLDKIRTSLINIDAQIIDDLNDLFMGIY